MMKSYILLIASLLFIAIVVAAKENPQIDNWCEAGGPWDDGRCSQGDEYQQDWYWTCGWYMAQVDKGTFTIEELRGNVPLCESLYESGYVPQTAYVAAPEAIPSETPQPEATSKPSETVATPETTPEPTETPTRTTFTGDKILRIGFGPNEPNSIDPAIEDFGTAEQILHQTHMGLTAIDHETMEVIPGMATSWDILDNGDSTFTYTFNLRDDIPWVLYNPVSGQVESLGRMLKASDFEYGIKRTIQEDYYYASYVLAPEIIDVEAIDEYTLQIKVSRFVAYQETIFAQWYTFAQPEWLIEQYGEEWTEDEHFASYGPYALKEWKHEEQLTLAANPYWPETVKIDEIQFVIAESDELLAGYENGELDYLWDIPSSQTTTIYNNPQFEGQILATPESGVYFYGFSPDIPPFDNVHCRRAFSFAIDRQVITDTINFGQVAPYFSSLNMIGSPQPEDYPDLGISYDPDRALDELDQCLDEKRVIDIHQLPRPQLLINSGSTHGIIATAIQQMWLENLGVEVEIVEVEFAVLVDSRNEYPIWRSGWVADFPDAYSSMGIFVSSDGYFGDIIHSTAYDELLQAAAETIDVAERTELYAQANQMLVYDAALVIPIYWYVRTQLTQPYVIRTASRLNYERYDTWDIN